MTPTKPTDQYRVSTSQAVSLTMRTALEHHDEGRLREAAALYKEVQSIDPGNADALFLLGLIAISIGNYTAAEGLLGAAAKRRVRAVHVQRAYGEALRRNGRRSAAQAVYLHVVSIDPHDPRSYVELAEVLAEVKPGGGNERLALSTYQRALKMRPSYAAAHAGVGNLHLRAGRFEEAEMAYRSAIEADQTSARYRNALGVALYRQKQYASAADAFRSAIRLHPQSAGAYLNLGNALRAMGEARRAEESYRRALELHPRYAKGWNNLANVLSETGHFEDAVHCYQRALALRADADVWCNLGQALACCDRMTEAQLAYEQALRLSPHKSAARAALMRVREVRFTMPAMKIGSSLPGASPVQ